MTSSAREKGGGHGIMTMCDVGGAGVTSAVRPGQGIVDDSASIQEIISTYQNFNKLILCLLKF